MATILTSRNSEGTRRCDSSCHNAKRPKCHCICGGRYHGRGDVAAKEQLQKDWLGDTGRELIAEVAATGGELKIKPTQLELGLDAVITEFTVLGPPHVKGSTVSFIGKDGRVVTKTDSVGLRGWTRDVFWAAKAARVPLARKGEPVRVHVWFHFPHPKQRVRQSPTVRPDIDKLTRALLDALTGAAYMDDAQVVELIAVKRYADDARTIVSIGDVAEE